MHFLKRGGLLWIGSLSVIFVLLLFITFLMQYPHAALLLQQTLQETRWLFFGLRLGLIAFVWWWWPHGVARMAAVKGWSQEQTAEATRKRYWIVFGLVVVEWVLIFPRFFG